MVAFFLRAPADLESVGRGGSTTITFVAKQLNHGLSLPTKRSGIVFCNLVAERDRYGYARDTLPLLFHIFTFSHIRVPPKNTHNIIIYIIYYIL